MRNIVILIMFVLVGFSATAQEKSKNARYEVEVNGNCEMCKKRIEKAAFSVSGVKSALWHIDDQMLHLILNEQKTSIEEVEKAVADAGHDTQNVKATDEDYSGLHHCCMYERK